MTTVKVHAEIDVNGKLRLDVPIDLPAGSAEVLIVVQPESSNGQRKASQGVRTARSGLFVGNPTDNLDVDAALNELNDGWKAKLKDVAERLGATIITRDPQILASKKSKCVW